MGKKDSRRGELKVMEEPIATYEKARWNKRIGTVRVYDNRVEEPWLTSWDTTAVQ